MTVRPQGIDANSVLIRFAGVSALGLPQSNGASTTPQVTAQARDGDGSTSEITYTDWVATVNVAYIPDNSATWPVHNDIVQVAGYADSNWNGAYRVTSIGEEYTNQGYPAKNATLVRHLDNGVPSATTTTSTTTTT